MVESQQRNIRQTDKQTGAGRERERERDAVT